MEGPTIHKESLTTTEITLIVPKITIVVTLINMFPSKVTFTILVERILTHIKMSVKLGLHNLELLLHRIPPFIFTSLNVQLFLPRPTIP